MYLLKSNEVSSFFDKMAIHPKVVDVICFEQAVLQCWYIMPSSSFSHLV